MGRHYVVSQVRDSEYCILGVFNHLREAQRLVEKTALSAHGIPALEVWEGDRVLHDEVPEAVVHTAYLREGGEVTLYQHVQRTSPIRATVVVSHSFIRAVGTDRDEVLQKVAEATQAH